MRERLAVLAGIVALLVTAMTGCARPRSFASTGSPIASSVVLQTDKQASVGGSGRGQAAIRERSLLVSSHQGRGLLRRVVVDGVGIGGVFLARSADAEVGEAGWVELALPEILWVDWPVLPISADVPDVGARLRVVIAGRGASEEALEFVREVIVVEDQRAIGFFAERAGASAGDLVLIDRIGDLCPGDSGAPVVKETDAGLALVGLYVGTVEFEPLWGVVGGKKYGVVRRLHDHPEALSTLPD